MATFGNDEATAQRAHEVIKQLVKAFDEIMQSDGLRLQASADEELTPIAFGWWARINRTSEAVVLLYDAGLAHESAPLVRNIMQHTLALQWLIDMGKPALEAVHEYRGDQFRNLAGSVQRAGWDLPENIEVPAKPTKPNLLVNQLKNFEQMCSVYEYSMHTLFRVLSAYSHPTGQSAQAYFDHIEGERAKLSGRSVVEPYRYIIQTAISLVQAGLVINGLLDGGPLSGDLERAREQLGTIIQLPKRKEI